MFISKRGQGNRENVLLGLENLCRERIARGLPVYNLSAGTPDLAPDKHVMEALSKAALDAQNYRYAISDFSQLIDAAIYWYKNRFGIELSSEQVTSVYGTQEGMAHILFPLIDEGDIVLLPEPCYPVFGSGAEMAGAKIEYMPLLEKNNYLIDFDSINPETAEKAKVMVVSYPNNPVSVPAPKEFYCKLVDFAKRNNIFVIHDNAYCELVLEGEPGGSFLQIPGAIDIGVEFNSLSKAYNLTGMRTSFLLGNAEVIAAFKKFRSQIDYGPFPAIQKATIAALTGPQDILERNRVEYRKRRNALCQSMQKIGWKMNSCTATMFMWVPLPQGFTDDVKFAYDLADTTGVICVPGSSFGESGKGYVRFALVLPEEKIGEAILTIGESGFIKR